MNVDFRLLRRSALAVCGAALLGFTVAGCVSAHKPNFWDQDDMKGTADTSGAPSATTPPAATAAASTPASTVVAADHTSTDDPTGHASPPDFADSTPSPAGTQTAATSDSQPAPQTKSTAPNDAFAPAAPQTAGSGAFGDKPPATPPIKPPAIPLKASDPFADTVGTPPAAPVPTPDINVSTTPITASPSKGSSSANPFAESDNPVFAGKDQTQPAGPPAQPAMPAPPEGAAALQPTSVSPPPASPEPIASSQPAPLADAAPAQPAAPQAAPTVAAADSHKNAVDPFADSSLSAAPAATPAPVHAADDKPSCAAPAPSQNYSTGVPTPGSSTVGNAVAAGSAPSRAPGSTEQVNDLVAPPNDSQAAEMVIPAVKTATPKVDAKPSVATVSAHTAEPTAGEEPQWTHAALQATDATVTDSMILDSNSVRGRFTGTEHATGALTHPSPVVETPHNPQPQPMPQPRALPVHTAPSPPQPVAPPKAEPLSRSDSDDPFATAASESVAAGQAEHEPVSKSLSGVVNAVAQQDGPPPAADPFALEQTVDTSAADSIHVKAARSTAKSEAPQAFDPFDASGAATSSEVLVADSSAAPSVAHYTWRVRSETWFVIGLAAGLIGSLIVWLRSRPKTNQTVNG
jgi:hypothetical protein